MFAVLTALILVVPLLSERVRIPATVGLILAGALVGPGALGLLVREGAVGTLGSAGLLYLLFLAGLELDLDEFARNRRDSIVFGVLTFAVPMTLGFGSSLLLGFGVLPSVLIASCWASHTLLSYPIFRRHGVAASRSVATGVGGTILTDTAALMVLVVVVRAHGGALSGSFLGLLALGTGVLGVVTMAALPRLGRWFFGSYAQDAGVRFAFILAALFASSALAHLVGLEPIIGAFLAGLGLNRLVPNGSRLMDRIEFLGGNLLTPIFLISVGLLIDFRLLSDPRTILMAVVFTTVAVAAKGLAAMASGKVLGYSRAEVGALFALSNAQAAATLAAVVIGLRAGLIDTDVVNAVVMVILVSCLVASWVAGRVAPRLVAPMARRTLGTAIVVPIVRPESSAPMVRIAAALALEDGGLVIPLTIAPAEVAGEELDRLRQINVESERLARTFGVEAEGILRIDSTPAAGVARTVRERGASLILVGWLGPDHAAMFMPHRANPMVAEAPCPVLLASLDGRRPERVTVLLAHADLTAGGLDNLHLALEAARRVAHLYRCPVRGISCVRDAALLEVLRSALGSDATVDPRAPAAVIREWISDDELLMLPARADDLDLRHAERLKRVAGRTQVMVAAGGGRRAGVTLTEEPERLAHTV